MTRPQIPLRLVKMSAERSGGRVAVDDELVCIWSASASGKPELELKRLQV